MNWQAIAQCLGLQIAYHITQHMKPKPNNPLYQAWVSMCDRLVVYDPSLTKYVPREHPE